MEVVAVTVTRGRRISVLLGSFAIGALVGWAAGTNGSSIAQAGAAAVVGLLFFLGAKALLELILMSNRLRTSVEDLSQRHSRLSAEIAASLTALQNRLTETAAGLEAATDRIDAGKRLMAELREGVQDAKDRVAHQRDALDNERIRIDKTNRVVNEARAWLRNLNTRVDNDLTRSAQLVGEISAELAATQRRLDPVREAFFRDPRLSGDWSFTEFKYLVELFRSGSIQDPQDAVFVDVGAQYGVYSEAFASLGWRVVGFEASPDNFEVLARRFADRPFVDVRHAAVGDENRDAVRFYVNPAYAGINSLAVNHEHLTESRYHEVPLLTLDAALDGSVDRVTFLKTDIEGADLLALRGFDTGRWQPDVIASEYVPDRAAVFGWSLIDLVEWGEARGYRALVSSWDAVAAYRSGSQSPRLTLQHVGWYEPGASYTWGDVIFVKADWESHAERTLARFYT